MSLHLASIDQHPSMLGRHRRFVSGCGSEREHPRLRGHGMIHGCPTNIAFPHSSALLSGAPAALEPPRPALACVLLCRFLQQVSENNTETSALAPPTKLSGFVWE